MSEASQAAANKPPAPPWALDVRVIAQTAGVDPERGLSAREARRRLQRYGPNRLHHRARRSVLAVLLAQFKSIIILLLAVAALLAFAFGDNVEGTAVLAVIFLNAMLGFGMELRALRSMDALRLLGSVEATVLRDGEAQKISAAKVVPGDVLLVEAGDRITTDMRLFEANRLKADESTLTGESLPASKHCAAVPEAAPLAERSCLLYKGTHVTRGSGAGIAVATGMNTELGRISALVAEAPDETTPLERRLSGLGARLTWLSFAIVLALVPLGLAAGRGLVEVVKLAVVLAVASVPEGLPIVATIALARGMRRMAQRNVLIERLAAVETLGATTCIFSDKTGTLTENCMRVESILLEQGEVLLPPDRSIFELEGQPLEAEPQSTLRRLLEVGVLCSNASLHHGHADEQAVGDPLEIALLVAADRAGITEADLDGVWPEVREEAFDPSTRMMATLHRSAEGIRVAVKGAPEAVLAVCERVATPSGARDLDDAARDAWLERCQEAAREGQRLLTAAEKLVSHSDEPAYAGLTLLGIFAMRDPPRVGVRDALQACRAAGIRVAMATGDLAETAAHIAKQVGLCENPSAWTVQGSQLDADPLEGEALGAVLRAQIVARCSPEHKLRLVQLHQQHGEVVAMIGDGVNDAPALKRADIGVALGRRGTQVAREASDMVLRDDSFAGIILAIEQGRIIFDNIRNFVVYLLATNASEILLVAGATLCGLPLPLYPLQILYLNLLADVFPALALGLGDGRPDVLSRPPRPRLEPVLTRSHWRSIAAWSALLSLSVLACFATALLLGWGPQRAASVAFVALAIGQVLHVFNLRRPGAPLLVNAITTNRWIWAALAVCGLLILLAVYLPGLASVLKVVEPGAEGWGLIAIGACLPLLLGQLYLWYRSPAAKRLA